MAQGLGFIEFSTGDVLSAAAANGYLASQTVMVFADAAARTAAITTPYEGMISYLKDTNSTEYYSGSAWVAIGGASGSLTLLSTTSLSGATTTISSISGAYKNLVILIKDFYPSSNADLVMSVNGDNTAANYASLVMRAQTTSDGTFADNTVAGTYISGYQVINTQQDSFAAITIPDYANATTKKVINVLCNSTTNSSAKAITNTVTAYHGTVAAISSISIKTLTGSWSAGSVEIYGQN
jgi:hypothetical protein